MVWLYRSPIPAGRKGVFYSFNDFYLPSHSLEEGGRGSAPCDYDVFKNKLNFERENTTLCNLCTVQAVLESGIPIDRIGGVSIGAFMGALWCQERDIGQVHFSSWFIILNKFFYMR
jgi:hypothetical protein